MPRNPPAGAVPGGICDMTFEDILVLPRGLLADTDCLEWLEATA